MKSLSFVCLTSEVRVLFVASCFQVCSQQYGQCVFVSPGPFWLRMSPTKWFGLIAWQRNPVQRSSHYLYRDEVNSREWRLNLIFERVIWQVNCVIIAQLLWQKTSFCFLFENVITLKQECVNKLPQKQFIQNKHIYEQIEHATMLSVLKSPSSTSGKMAILHASRQNNTTYREFKTAGQWCA